MINDMVELLPWRYYGSLTYYNRQAKYCTKNNITYKNESLFLHSIKYNPLDTIS